MRKTNNFNILAYMLGNTEYYFCTSGIREANSSGHIKLSSVFQRQPLAPHLRIN